MEEFLSKIEKKEVTVLLSHYELKRMLGKGEDGCVFLADCTTDKKQCAIKFGNEVKQFFVFAAKENEVLLLMQGKGIPKIHDIFRQLDRSFLASELVGDSLHKIQEKCGGKISLKFALGNLTFGAGLKSTEFYVIDFGDARRISQLRYDSQTQLKDGDSMRNDLYYLARFIVESLSPFDIFEASLPNDLPPSVQLFIRGIKNLTFSEPFAYPKWRMKPSLEIWYNILPFLCADQLDKIELVNRELTVIKKRFFRKHPYCSMYAMFIRSKGYYIVKECPVVGEVTENHPHFPLEEPDININNYRRVSARMIAEQMGQVVKPNVRFKCDEIKKIIALQKWRGEQFGAVESRYSGTTKSSFPPRDRHFF